MASELQSPLLESAKLPLLRRMTSLELKGIHAALDAVDGESQRVQEEGFSQVSFFLGVLNVPLACFVFAWYPQHFWLLYCAECLLLIPLWFLQMRRVYHGELFILDFCWLVNTAAAVRGLLAAFNVYSIERGMLLCFFAIANGPLAWACIVLHNGLIFHSVEKIASLTIHLLPLLVALTLTHDNDRVQEAWPGRFPARSDLIDATFAEMVLRGLAVYCVWWLPYVVWLLVDGVSRPERGSSTVFDQLRKKGLGKRIQTRTGLSGVRSHAAVYMVGHLLAVLLSFVWPPLCLRWHVLHASFGIMVFVAAAWNGAGYYEFLMAHRYTKVVKSLVEQRERKRQGVSQ